MTSESFDEDSSKGYNFWLQFWCKIIAGSEVIGGLAGLYLVLFGRLDGYSRFIFLFGFVFFVASIWGGILLAANKPSGILASLVVQALQVLQVNAAGVVYSLVCVPQLLLGYYFINGEFNIGVSWGLLAKFMIFWKLPSTTVPGVGDSGIGQVLLGVITGINLVPLGAILCLLLVRAAKQNGMLGKSAPNNDLIQSP